MAKSGRFRELDGIIIAIDGPAGSGKSTTAKLVATKLGLIFLDTGAMYRAVGLQAIRSGIAFDDAAALAEITRAAQIDFSGTGENQRVLFDGEDVTDLIRTPDVSDAASAVSRHAEVRKELVRRQQEIGEKGNIVAEGRDTTSVVFPRAEVKIFLKADVETRSKRRAKEYEARRKTVTIDDMKKEIVDRDRQDSTRAASPLVQVDDAIVIDTSNLSITEQVDKVIAAALAVRNVKKAE